MAHAARPAPRPAPAHAALASLLAIGLALAPCHAHAEPAGSPPAAESPTDPETPPDGTIAPTPDPAAAPVVPDDVADDAEPIGPPGCSDHDRLECIEDDDAPLIDDTTNETDETDETDDETDDETTDDETDPPASAQGEPLRPLQTAAWWTMFGAFSVGTTAGVLAGLAERQEDRATRLSTLFDAETGAQPRYADHQQEYEDYLRRGQAYARAAIGVGIVAGLTTAAAITLFAIDARRQRAERDPKTRSRAALRVRAGGVEVRF